MISSTGNSWRSIFAVVALVAMVLTCWSSLVYAVERVDRGTLYLDLTGPTEFRWDYPSTPIVQEIVERRCEINWFGSPRQLVDLFASGGVSPGFVDYLGVYGGGNGNSGRGTPCGQMNPGQGLRLELTGELAGLRARFAELDLQLKGSPEATITTKLGDTTTGTYRVRAGSAIDPTTVGTAEVRLGRTATESGELIEECDPADDPSTCADPLPRDNVVYNCAGLTDSGPDSGDRDNCRITINTLWDEISINAVGGDVSLGGGGDGGFTSTPSYFVLEEEFDGILDCNDTVTVIGEEGSFGELRRLPNNAEEGQCGACVAIPYNLTFAANTLAFTADYLEGTADSPQTCAAFAFTVNFEYADLSEPGVRPSPGNVLFSAPFGNTVTGKFPLAIEQQFLDTDPSYYLDTCLGTPIYALSDDTGSPPAYLAGDLIRLDGSFPDMSDLVGTQYGCWLNVRLKYGVDSGVQATGSPPGTEGFLDELRLEVDGYVQGDWRLRY